MRNMSSTLFLALLMGMTLLGSALILSIPPLFRPHGQEEVWITAILGFLFLVFAVGTRHLRPAHLRR